MCGVFFGYSTRNKAKKKILTDILLRDLLRIPHGLAVADVVELRHDVPGAVDVVPDVEETLVGVRRAPSRVGLDSVDELRELVNDFGAVFGGGEAEGRHGGYLRYEVSF